MGQVWQATDTQLNRQVALKILPDAFASDPDRLARFTREAQILASLNHPNIAAIFGIEESEGTRALVLELVEGPTLADRIAKGPIPLDEALPIARQIAEALEAAHEAGVIHRDLKPANIKVREDGTVKVLDFGLAKALDPNPEADPSQSPTLTAAATQMGVIMGTAAYMSPEQAKGRQVDKRADIWAFGVVLFEMLTGRQAFVGTDISETLASVLMREIDWAALPSKTPASVRRMLRRCVTRDRKNRLADMSMARLEIDEADAASEAAGETAATQVAQLALWQRPIFAAAALVLTAVVAGFAVWTLIRPAAAPITRLSIVLPQTQVRTNTSRRGVAISPTGTHVVYVANEQLYLRALDELEAQPLTGTEGSNPATPFFSPNGQWIGFFSRQDQELKKVAVSGGAAVTLAAAANPYGASWGADDTIVFGQYGQGILRVAGAGGTPDVLVSVDAPGRAHQPQILPGGEAVLYTLGSFRQWDAAQIVVEQVATGERTVVVEGGSDARYLPTGHLVYALGDTLLAVAFDVDRREVTGGAVPLVQGVARALLGGAANFGISETGSLVYLGGGAAEGVARTLVWVNREGHEEPLASPPLPYRAPRVSPNGTRVAVDVVGPEGGDIWIHDLSRETETILTTDPADDYGPLWTPNGEWVVFTSTREGQVGAFQKRVDTPGDAERLMAESEGTAVLQSTSWSADGQTLIFWEISGTGATNTDIGLLSMEGDRARELLLDTEFNEAVPAISPAGDWIAYDSNETGQDEVYVQRFPGLGGKVPISTDGGRQPVWAPDGSELYYRGPRGMMVVPLLETESTLRVGDPSVLFETQYFFYLSQRTYDIAPDGQRFLMVKEAETGDEGAVPTQIHVIQNWTQELLERVPIN